MIALQRASHSKFTAVYLATEINMIGMIMRHKLVNIQKTGVSCTDC
jgi:hypothetical protein